MDHLRYYQREAVEAFSQSKEGHPLIILPTGSGKTHVIAGICATNPDARVLIISHVKEILAQNAEKLKLYVDPKKVGVYSSGLQMKQLYYYCVAGIQSIYKKPELFKKYDIIIVDEAHMIPPSGEGRYQTFFKALPNARVIGLTATPFRTGHGHLTDDHLFTEVIYEADIVKLIEEGYLADLSTKQPRYMMDTTGIKVVAGDFSKRELAMKLDKKDVTSKVLHELVTKYKDTRKSWLIFAIDIDHAININKKLRELGVASAAIHSKMEDDRAQYTELFKSGALQALVSIETLTTGFDAPNVDLIALMRPTQSPVLHVQMLGRGMRIAPDKQDCLVLDFAGNTARLGPINDIAIERKKKGQGKRVAPLTKACPSCQEIVAVQTVKCKSCGHIFTFKEDKLSDDADETPVINKGPKNKINIQSFNVTAIEYYKHLKVGKRPTLKVTYRCGLRFFNEWIALEHEGYPKVKAKHWWEYRSKAPVPATVDEALELKDTLRKPSVIYVSKSSVYPEIIRYEFAERL